MHTYAPDKQVIQLLEKGDIVILTVKIINLIQKYGHVLLWHFDTHFKWMFKFSENFERTQCTRKCERRRREHAGNEKSLKPK